MMHSRRCRNVRAGIPDRSRTALCQTLSVAVLLALFAAFAPIPASALSPLSSPDPQASLTDAPLDETSLEGTVQSAQGTPLEGAVVQIPVLSRSALADARGSFRFADLPEGEHVVQTSYLGYGTRQDTVFVTEGESSTLEIILQQEVLEVDAVTVEAGARGSRVAALNEQFASNRIGNIVGAETIGEYADANVAEALQRVPGVLMSASNDEGGTASMRGLPSDFMSLTINGVRTPSISTSGRGNAVGIMNAEAVESIEVTKAVTPDMDAESTGGSINIRTRRMSGIDPIRRIRMEGGAQVAEQTLPNWSGSAAFGEQIGRAGVMIDGSVRRTQPYYHGMRTNGWDEVELDGQTVRQPDRLRQNFYEAERLRYGMNANVDFDAGPGSRFFVRTSLNFSEDERTNAQYRFDRLGFVSDEEIEGSRGRHYGRFYDYSYRMNTVSAGGEHEFGGAKLDYRASWAQSGSAAPYVRATFRQDGLNFSFDGSDVDRPRFSPTGDSRPYDVAMYRMIDLRTRNDRNRDQDLSGAVNLEVPFSLGASDEHSFKVGAQFTDKDKMRQRDYDRWRGWPEGTTMADLSNRADAYNFLEGNYDFGPRLDRGMVDAFIAENLDNMTLDVNYSRAATDVSSYRASERVTSGYAMSTFNIGRLMVLGGARYEHTALSHQGNDVIYDQNGDYVSTEPLNQDEGYGDLFPMAQVRWRLGEETNLRLAATRTLTRPSHYSMVPYQEVDMESGIVNRGNSELVPARIRNLDVIFERYLPQYGGVVSIGGFHKDVRDYITNQLFIEDQGPWTGFPVIQPVNGLQARLWGIEVNWMQDLAFLPGALSGLGVSANYTHTQSSADYGEDVRQLQIGDREVPVPGQSDHVGNVSVNYRWGGFFANVSANHRGQYLSGLGNDADGLGDEWVDDRTRFDLSMRQRIPALLAAGLGNASLQFEATNLTGANQRYFEGVGQNTTRLRSYSRTFRLGLTMDF